MARTQEQCVDLLIVGGGINGVGIARDAVGRGLSVMLVEQADLAAHTSSASTKLIHGGLRYLEHGEFRLVREALRERERLLHMAPHIIRPLRFVLPQAHSPRPAWLVRLGLFLYDHLARRRHLPGTDSIALAGSPFGDGMVMRSGKAFVYSDCWVDDSRLVVLTALDAAERGANIRTRTRFVGAERADRTWNATIVGIDGATTVHARALVNAAGPWVSDLIALVPESRSDRAIRLVKGSHIVVPRLYEGEHAFILQNDDRRIVFAIPYEDRFTLVGTTEENWQGEAGAASIGPMETDYLLATIARYFLKPVQHDDIVWSYAGIRPLHEDHAANASAITRDYALDIDAPPGCAPILSVFGGKITTHRKLAEHAMRELASYLPQTGGAWTSGAPLPGGDMPGANLVRLFEAMRRDYPGLPPDLILRLTHAYGTRARRVLGDARTISDLGTCFGSGLTSREIDYLVDVEWAITGEDVLFRRSKIGLHLDAYAADLVGAYVTQKTASKSTEVVSSA